MIKTTLKKKKCKKAKWLSEEDLQIAEKRRGKKGKGEKERYTHLNAEFQRILRRDKKAFLSHQCKQTEEKSRMGKTRDLFKKIGETKGTFHANISCNMPASWENSAVATGLKKVSFHSSPKKRQCQRMFKLPHNCTHLTH